jgi:plasmid stability protein
LTSGYKNASILLEENIPEKIMAALVIKQLPDRLHRRLKEEAARNRRSMTQQALAILERALAESRGSVGEEPPPPLELKVRHDHKWIYAAVRRGRK